MVKNRLTLVIRYVFLSVYLLLFVSWIGVWSLKINEKEKIHLPKNQKNIKIELSAKTIRGTTNLIKVKVVRGNIVVSPDELALIFNPSVDKKQFKEPYFTYRKKIKNANFNVEQGGFFEYNFYLSPLGTEGRPKEVLILPSDFIMYDGKPLITDTIRIALR